MAPLDTALNYITTSSTRRWEFQSDEFSASLGQGKHLQSALIKLHMDNLQFPVYDTMYSNWNHDHPTLVQRLQHLKELEQKKN